MHGKACLRTVDCVMNLVHMSLIICRFLADSFVESSNYLGALCERENFQCLEFIGKKSVNALKFYANKTTNWKQINYKNVFVFDEL